MITLVINPKIWVVLIISKGISLLMMKTTFTPLNVYQLTALKEFSRNLVKELNLNKSENQPNDLPQNDATSACSFFSLGIIDKFSSAEYIMSWTISFTQNLTYHFRISKVVKSYS